MMEGVHVEARGQSYLYVMLRKQVKSPYYCLKVTSGHSLTVYLRGNPTGVESKTVAG